MNTLNYEVDDTIQNKVVELAKEKLVWLENFKNKNGGIDKDLDEEIQFQMEEMRDWINDYSNRKINVKCCQRAVKELSEDIYYVMISHIMGKTFRVALADKVNKHEYNKRHYYAKAVVPYFNSDGGVNTFEYNLSNKYVFGVAEYVNKDGENTQCHVDLYIDDLKGFNNKLHK